MVDQLSTIYYFLRFIFSFQIPRLDMRTERFVPCSTKSSLLLGFNIHLKLSLSPFICIKDQALDLLQIVICFEGGLCMFNAFFCPIFYEIKQGQKLMCRLCKIIFLSILSSINALKIYSPDVVSSYVNKHRYLSSLSCIIQIYNTLEHNVIQ